MGRGSRTAQRQPRAATAGCVSAAPPTVVAASTGRPCPSPQQPLSASASGSAGFAWPSAAASPQPASQQQGPTPQQQTGSPQGWLTSPSDGGGINAMATGRPVAGRRLATRATKPAMRSNCGDMAGGGRSALESRTRTFPKASCGSGERESSSSVSLPATGFRHCLSWASRFCCL